MNPSIHFINFTAIFLLVGTLYHNQQRNSDLELELRTAHDNFTRLTNHYQSVLPECVVFNRGLVVPIDPQEQLEAIDAAAPETIRSSW